MKTGRRPHKISPEQASDIRSYLQSHKWRGAKSAVAKKYSISQGTLRAVMLGMYFRNELTDARETSKMTETAAAILAVGIHGCILMIIGVMKLVDIADELKRMNDRQEKK